MNYTVYYFGYGANRNADMMRAIVGRKPKGYAAVFDGYELCIQSWGDIPKRVQNQLAPVWGPGFKSYVARPCREKSIKGTVWLLTKEERVLVDEWELTNYWYTPVVVSYGISNNEIAQVEIQIVIDGQSISQIADGKKYKTFLNSKQQMLTVAQKVRELSIVGRGPRRQLN